MPTYDFRLPPGPRTVEYALLAEDLGFRAVWCPEIPAFGHDIWVTLARIAEKNETHQIWSLRADPELSARVEARQRRQAAIGLAPPTSSGVPELARLRHSPG